MLLKINFAYINKEGGGYNFFCDFFSFAKIANALAQKYITLRYTLFLQDIGFDHTPLYWRYGAAYTEVRVHLKYFVHWLPCQRSCGGSSAGF